MIWMLNDTAFPKMESYHNNMQSLGGKCFYLMEYFYGCIQEKLLSKEPCFFAAPALPSNTGTLERHPGNTLDLVFNYVTSKGKN